jgi:hypothetical protein
MRNDRIRLTNHRPGSGQAVIGAFPPQAGSGVPQASFNSRAPFRDAIAERRSEQYGNAGHEGATRQIRYSPQCPL